MQAFLKIETYAIKISEISAFEVETNNPHGNSSIQNETTVRLSVSGITSRAVSRTFDQKFEGHHSHEEVFKYLSFGESLHGVFGWEDLVRLSNETDAITEAPAVSAPVSSVKKSGLASYAAIVNSLV